jgi:DNA-binding MarR family transcriptional regulator
MKPKPDASPPRTWVQIRALRSLLLAAERFRETARPVFAEGGLTLAEFDVISALGNKEGLRMKDVAATLMASSSTSNVTRLCISLEKRGLLQRRRSPESDREVIASLTKEGQALFERMFPIVTTFTRDYADKVFSVHELEILHTLLARLVAPTS